MEGEDVEVTNDYPEYPNSLYTGDKGEVTWEVDVKEAGFYNLYLEYMTVKSKGVSIERSIYINVFINFPILKREDISDINKYKGSEVN